ncbi:uncharacterized protein LOC113746173 [Larimichthys crocea]|uniref:uncharacterized protein LOC113746173 n=1 Tax=Larimichthys crocea TaxID=215358 RepID=UPI000F5E0C57|nr:uncharacterized protein LOC113746173 [Larimichthys crocea]
MALHKCIWTLAYIHTYPRSSGLPPAAGGRLQPAKCVPPPGEAAASLPGGSAPGLPPAAGEVRPPAGGGSGLPPWRVRTRAAAGSRRSASPRRGKQRPPSLAGPHPGCRRQPAKCALSVNWFLFINFLDVTDDVTDDVISHMTSPENGARELHVTCDIIGHMTSPVGMLHQHINRIP